MRLNKKNTKLFMSEIAQAPLSKSNGVSLISHSNLVARFSEIIAQKKHSNPEDTLFLQAVRCSGLLHDIAKVIEKNQEKIKKGKKMNTKPDRHNEQAWAFLSKHLHCESRELKEMVLYGVYWHHGIEGGMAEKTNDVIYDNIGDEDLKRMILCTKDLLFGNNEFSCLEEPSLKNQNQKSPVFYSIGNEDEDVLERKIFLRMCLISADRIVSELESENKEWPKDEFKLDAAINSHIDNLMLIKGAKSIENIKFKNERFKIQKGLTDDEAQTICFNAPAGFGKTIAALYWMLRNGEKVIWVCPRNTVAKSVYQSILETFSEFKIKNITVELFLGGVVEESNWKHKNGFESDLIITNIDNFSSPTYDNRTAKNLFFVMNSNVVFDEYHEFVASEKQALFSCFINILRARHRQTTSRTLLISATPIYGIEQNWDYDSNRTKHLPGLYKHYPAAHEKKYKLNVFDNEDDLSKINENSSSLIVYNSIGEVQRCKINFKNSMLYHGDFEKGIKTAKLWEIFRIYGKHSERTLTKDNVISTHALQASADISFSKLYESIISPLSTLQRVGRIDRWGDYDLVPEINVFKSENNSEKRMIEILYDSELCKKWFNFLKLYNGELLTISDFYELYNEFNNANQKEIKRYINNTFSKSQTILNKIYPIQIDTNNNTEDKDKKNLVAGSNKIRATGSEIFCIYPKKGTDEFTEIFNVTVYGNNFSEVFKEKNDGDVIRKKQNAMSRIIQNKDERYDYSSLIKCENLDTIRRMARNSTTPYIAFNEIYDHELGLVKIKD